MMGTKRAARMMRMSGVMVVAILAVAVTCARGGAAPQQWHLDIDKAMDAIGVTAGMTVGEAGAGDGYFTFALADRVGARGAVYANDIDRGALARLDARSRRERRANIVTVAGDTDDPLFPNRSLNMIVIVHAFHDFGAPVQWLRNARKYLHAGGTIAVVDRDPASTGERHFLARDRIAQLFAEAGYEAVKSVDVERDHLVMTFRARN